MGNLIVILIIAIAVFFAVRSIIKSRKAHSACTGNCASCGCCSSSNGKAKNN